MKMVEVNIVFIREAKHVRGSHWYSTQSYSASRKEIVCSHDYSVQRDRIDLSATLCM